MLVESRSVLLTSITTDVIAEIGPVYVSLTRCQVESSELLIRDDLPDR